MAFQNDTLKSLKQVALHTCCSRWMEPHACARYLSRSCNRASSQTRISPTRPPAPSLLLPYGLDDALFRANCQVTGQSTRDGTHTARASRLSALFCGEGSVPRGRQVHGHGERRRVSVQWWPGPWWAWDLCPGRLPPPPTTTSDLMLMDGGLLLQGSAGPRDRGRLRLRAREVDG